MTFSRESDFEEALIAKLQTRGWEAQVLKYPTQADLIRNWANILYENNRGIDRLNDTPLTEGEMQQILEQIAALRTPLKLNGFINGKTVSVKRDNPQDNLHCGKEVSLKIYDRQEIAAGQSRYQIAQQPEFLRQNAIAHDRRGDLMLLINGMPVFHIELKKSGIPISQATNQIEKYASEGLFSGLFALIQIFVAMTPEQTQYFANPGPDGRFNPSYYFHWADFNNEPINAWHDIATSLLSIPMAHQLIGFYTVADDSDGVLKVMRSYQYYAANAISDKVSKADWHSARQLGGYIWHTTGSGKTMTSFKSAQLIANSRDADKVVFLMDRIELGTQSLREYRAFADDNEDVQATENTDVLIAKLKSNDPANTLIVTSIQKMSNIKLGEGVNEKDLQLIGKKRIVIIVDEAHRSTFGDMLRDIKETFSSAMFFGFTGTPIHPENQKKFNTTTSVFGDELHRYSIADGIRDKNVLGFDPYMVKTYQDTDLRRAVALDKARASSVDEVFGDPKREEIYYRYMDAASVPMAGYTAQDGHYVKGIEDELPDGQYNRDEHRRMVVEDIRNKWRDLSHNSKFHALFATSSIPEAIEYYRLIKAMYPELRITALFDPNEGNTEISPFKTAGLTEIINDYNHNYGQDFDLAAHARFKKDIASRLAHKEPYTRIERDPEKQIDLLIVVEQMLTGFDSKWVNTLYMDKILRYENIIQAFSRTNRLFGHDKPFGTIRYYRKPCTMETYITEAVNLYSGNRPFGLFAQRLPENLKKLNQIFGEISELFSHAGIPDFERIPADPSECGKFAKLFKEFNQYLEAAQIQGFHWEQKRYGDIEVAFDQTTYLILAIRYKELFGGGGGSTDINIDFPYEIDGYLTEIDTGRIDADYMNSRFEKYLKELNSDKAEEALSELHKSFATLTQEEQKYANIFLHDVQSGNLAPQSGKSFRDYITEYMQRAKNDQIHRFSQALGLKEDQLRRIIGIGVTEASINEFGRFDSLKASVDRQKAKAFFEGREGNKLTDFQVNLKIDKLLRDFVLRGGFEV